MRETAPDQHRSAERNGQPLTMAPNGRYRVFSRASRPIDQAARHALRAFARELLTPVCPACHARPKPPARTACDDCLAALERLPSPRCPACGGALDSALERCAECLRLPARPWDHAVSACRFSGLARRVIHRFKYSRDTYVAPLLADLMAEDWQRHGAGSVDLVVPLPLHWTKRLTRGYNQAALLARPLAHRLRTSCKPVLRRCARTRQQAMLDFDERQRNMTGVFRVTDDRPVSGRHVLLIDDVLTTGATLTAAALALQDAGVDRISILTAARG